MDPYLHHHRPIGPPISGDPPPQNPFWYPSSSPPPPQHHQNYSHHHRPPPQSYLPPPQQQWDHAGDAHHYNYHQPPHQIHQQPPMPPPPPQQLPSYHHGHHPVPPYPGAVPSPHRYQLPPRPQHTPPPHPHQYPPPHPSPYPPPNQGGGNLSWSQQEGWEYPERINPYQNEEDWAARARAWADSKSTTENHHAQSPFTSTGRIDEHTYSYQDHYQQSVGPPPDLQQPSLPQLNHQQLPDIQREDPFHQPATFSSGSSSYHTDERPYYNIRDEGRASNADSMASSQKGYGSSSYSYEQEVPYSYSYAPGNREPIDSSDSSRLPLHLPVPTVPEIPSSHSTLPVRNMSMEQPRFAAGGQGSQPLADVSDLPLEFEPRPSNHEPHQKISYGNGDPLRSMGVMNSDATNSWNPSAASGFAFSQMSSASSGTQPPLSLHPLPAFGGVPATVSNFGPIVPPVTVPFGLGTGTSIHHVTSFPGDSNGSFNFSERPKKAAVPNWLREEIIKQKSVLANTVPAQPSENSLHFNGAEDTDKPFRTVNPSDSKSIDSTKSTEDDEDDEDDLEAARSAAINQEIKRVLTEILLKVTDELFDDIATQILDEDDLSVQVDERAVIGNRKVSPPPVVPTPKASAKVLIQVKKNSSKADGASENSSVSSPRGNVLGLANYASDDDDADADAETSNLKSSGMVVGASSQPEGSYRSSEDDILKKSDRRTVQSNTQEPTRDLPNIESTRNRMDVNGLPQKSISRNKEENYITGSIPQPSEKGPKGFSKTREELSIDGGKVNEVLKQNMNSAKLKDARLDSTGGRGNNGKSIIEECSTTGSKNISASSGQIAKRSDGKDLMKEAKTGKDKESHKTSDTNDKIIDEDKSGPMKKMDKKDDTKEIFEDAGANRGAYERDADTRNIFKHDSVKNERKESSKDKRDKYKEGGEKKGDQIKDGKQDRSTRVSRDSSRYSSKRSSSPSSRTRKSKENSSRDHGNGSSDEPSENSKRRKLQSNRSSISPSPTRSRKRQVSRSPHSKHSHRRHSSYSSQERRGRSRSRSPVHRRSTHKHDK